MLRKTARQTNKSKYKLQAITNEMLRFSDFGNIFLNDYTKTYYKGKYRFHSKTGWGMGGGGGWERHID